MFRLKKMLIFGILLLLPMVSSAQCAMCRAVIESGQDNSLAEGINNGIVYLMAIPYILIGALFYFIFRKAKQS
ncbi:MAG: hypothetical protein ACR2PH_16675 [Desulfobulbia bacterium]